MRFYLLLLPLAFVGCDDPRMITLPTEGAAQLTSLTTTTDFNAYWYAGDAEINSYELLQTQYGQERRGDAVLIFVTEPFSASKQVKLDDAAAAGDDKVSVLKMNATRKFPTGIYDYSMMTSVFTPVSLDQYPHTIKATSSAQEWCGQSFIQLNHRDGKYALRQNSYFESEGDEERTINDVLLEDELFNRLRIHPESVPTGTVELIPNLFHSRFTHEPLAPKQARIQWKPGDTTNQLQVEYLHLNRTLLVDVANDFPYEIQGWEERGDRGASKATLRKRMKTAYWNQNGNKFQALRDTLGFLN